MLTSTPFAEQSVKLLGPGLKHESLLISREELLALYKLYGMKPIDEDSLQQQAQVRNLMRAATHDAMRVLSWLAQYMAGGEDPVKEVIRMAIDANYEVPPEDSEWADSA